MPHYWFSHSANSPLNVPSQWSKTDIIQPWPLFPSMAHIEINVPLNKAAYCWASPLADGLIVVNKINVFLRLIDFTEFIHRSWTYELNLWTSVHPKCHNMELFYLFVLGPAWSLVTTLQVLSGWKLCTQSQKQPFEKEKTSVVVIKRQLCLSQGVWKMCNVYENRVLRLECHQLIKRTKEVSVLVLYIYLSSYSSVSVCLFV